MCNLYGLISHRKMRKMKTQRESSYRWVILALCFLGFTIKIAHEIVWVPIIPIAQDTLGFSIVQSSMMLTFRALGAWLTLIPGGFIIDRYGPKRAIIISIFFSGLFSLCVGISTSFEQALLCRFLTGLSEGPFYAGAMKMLMAWFPERQRGIAVGFFGLGPNVATIMINSGVPILTTAFSWRISFIIVACSSLFLSLLYCFLLKETDLLLQEKLLVQQEKLANLFGRLKEVYADRNLAVAILAALGGAWAQWGVAEWTGTYMKFKFAISNEQAGLVMAVWAFVALVTQPVVGFISDRMGGKRKPIVIADLILFTILLILVPFVKSMVVMQYLMVALGFAAFAYVTGVNVLIPELAKPYLIASALVGQNVILYGGQFLRPYVIGKILNTGSPNAFTHVFLVLALGSFVALISMIFVKETKKYKVEEYSCKASEAENA